MLLFSATDAKIQHYPGYFDTPLEMTAGTITPSNNTSWNRILRLFVTPDGHFTSYLVLCSATLTIALILFLLVVFLLVAKRRRSPLYGLSLKYLYLKTAEKVEFVKFHEEHKCSRKREPTFAGKYALLESRLAAAPKNSNHMDFSHLSNGQHFSFSPFTCVKKAALVSYLSFRVFYTFIFTFSVALSMLFSLWPPYLDGNTDSTQNPSVVPRGRVVGLRDPTVESSYSFVSQLPLAQQIAFSRETLTDEELSVQMTRATQLVLACQQLVITQIVDVVRELDHVIQKVLDDELSLPEVKWRDSVRTAMPFLIPPSGSSAAAKTEAASTPGTSPNLLQVMDTFVMWQVTEFHQAIQNYLRHLKTDVEYAMMPDVALFSDMLSRVYSSQWLLFARRMLNSTTGGYEGAGSGSRWWKPVDSADIVSPVDAETTGANMSKIDFARQLGLAEAENFLWTPTRIEKELEESGTSLAPPSKLIFWFLKNNSVAKSTEKEKGTKGHFKPTILRSFYPQDDNSILKKAGKTDTFIPQMLQRPEYNRHDPSTAYSITNFYVLTLAHIRLIFFILDCFLIIFRFYNTYVVLKEILIGKSVIIDASSYLTTVTSSSKNAVGADGAGKLSTNRDSKKCTDGGSYKEIGDSCPFSNEAYSHAVREDAFYYCRHQCSPKVQVSGKSNPARTASSRTYSHIFDKTMPDHYLHSVCSYRLVRPAKSVDEVSGSCVSSLRMRFSRTNQFIIILLGSAFFLFLAFVAISNGRGLLLRKRDLTPLPRVAENAHDQIGGKPSDTLERKSSYLVRQHARHLNSAFLAFTRRNEKQLRQRMSRFTARIRHDLLHVEGQLQQEKCEINKLTDLAWANGAQSRSGTSKTPSPGVCASSLKRHADFGLLLHQEMCQFVPISIGGAGDSKLRFRQSYADQKSRPGTPSARYPSSYLWHAVATWLGGSLTQPLRLGSSPGQNLQDSLLSQFLVVLLCIAVVMFGLVGVVRLLSCIFRFFFLEPRTLQQLAAMAAAGRSGGDVPRGGGDGGGGVLPPHIRLLSPCPPPSAHFCAELGFRSVWTDAPRHCVTHTQLTPSTSERMSPVRIVGTVLSGSCPGQYLLLPNSSPSVTYCGAERRDQMSPLAVTELPPSLLPASRESANPVGHPNNNNNNNNNNNSINSRLRHSEQVVT